MWLSIINLKKYDKIIIQTYVRVCSAQIIQFYFYWTFALSAILRKNVEIPWFYGVRGWQKLIAWPGNAANPIADSSTDFLQNFTLSISSKIPQKSSKIPNSTHSNPLSYHISLKPTKIKYFSHFQTQKSNFHLTKIYPQIQNLPYL